LCWSLIRLASIYLQCGNRGSRGGKVAAALISGEVFHGRPDGLGIAPDPYLLSHEALYAWLSTLDRLPVTLVLPTHGPPAPGGPEVIRRALERPPWTLPGSG
jgi:hypothetical protein